MTSRTRRHSSMTLLPTPLSHCPATRQSQPHQPAVLHSSNLKLSVQSSTSTYRDDTNTIDTLYVHAPIDTLDTDCRYCMVRDTCWSEDVLWSEGRAMAS